MNEWVNDWMNEGIRWKLALYECIQIASSNEMTYMHTTPIIAALTSVLTFQFSPQKPLRLKTNASNALVLKDRNVLTAESDCWSRFVYIVMFLIPRPKRASTPPRNMYCSTEELYRFSGKLTLIINIASDSTLCLPSYCRQLIWQNKYDLYVFLYIQSWIGIHI